MERVGSAQGIFISPVTLQSFTSKVLLLLQRCEALTF